ncbi:hypothetical protein [Clostridioides difficile]|nr:hypothetical protein [Clostridioides difficile]
MDEKIYYHEQIIKYLKQRIKEKSSFNETKSSLKRIFE